MHASGGLSVPHDGAALTQGLWLMLKPYPISSPEVLWRAARPKELSSHFEFVQGSVAEWVTSAWKVIALSSSTIYEVLSAGVPVKMVGREIALDLNSLVWYSDLGLFFHSLDQVWAETRKILALSAKDMAGYLGRGRSVSQQFWACHVQDATHVRGRIRGCEGHPPSLSDNGQVCLS